MSNQPELNAKPDRIIHCPSCGKVWNISKFNTCECGAVLKIGPPTAGPLQDAPSLPKQEGEKQEVPDDIKEWIDSYINGRLKSIVANSVWVEWIAERVCGSIREGATAMYQRMATRISDTNDAYALVEE